MRADALERRRRILSQARTVFAQQGSDVSLDAVAEASGVGIATLYRNFPSRDALISEVALDIIGDVTAVADAAATRVREPEVTRQEHEAAWRGFVDGLVALNLGALTDALGSDSGRLAAEAVAAQQKAVHVCDAVLQDLVQAGIVRPDLTALEVIVSIGIVTRPQSHLIREATPGLVEKLVAAFIAWCEQSER